MHFVFVPFALVHFRVRPYVLSYARYLIMPKLSSIRAPISEGQTAISMLFTVLILTLVFRTIRPLLNTGAMLLVLIPLPHICSTVGMLVGSMSMGFVVEPLALIYVSICVDKCSLSVCLVTLPLSIIFRAILPYLLSVAVFHPIK